jgi:LCP family protein required for cell wall assembly
VKKIWLALLLTGSLCLAALASLAPTMARSGSPFNMVVGRESSINPAPMPMGSEVVHVILLGTDRRPPNDGWRTDTMILVSIDLRERTASMVSIPRDLYVAIPGQGKARLNLADNIGEAQHYPGGGPALLKAILERDLGLTFDRYVRIDFQGLSEMIDALGGIDVDVRCPTELWVPNMKSPGEYLLVRSYPASMQHMDGELALLYSRCRTHTPVFDRDRRQREVLLAIRNRVLELGIPGLLPRLFPLLDSMEHHVQTDLEPVEIVALAQLVSEIPPSNIRQRTIDLSVAPEWYTAEGAWVMLPDRKLIKELMVGRLGPASWEKQALVQEGVGIAIDNGTTIEGFASQIADRLRSQGHQVVDVGKAGTLDYSETTITSYAGSSLTLEHLQQALGVSEDNVRYETDWLSNVAIRVIVGYDAQSSCR